MTHYIITNPQMAEMYGEIMELNERLHRKVANKDNVICKLVGCIREAGLEVGWLTLHHHSHTASMLSILHYIIHFRSLYQRSIFLLLH